MDMISALNNIAESHTYEKNIMTLKDFPKDKRLRILKAERKQTRFGKKIMLNLEDYFLFLPDKFNTIDDEALKELSSGQINVGKEMINDNKNFIFNFKRIEQKGLYECIINTKTVASWDYYPFPQSKLEDPEGMSTPVIGFSSEALMGNVLGMFFNLIWQSLCDSDTPKLLLAGITTLFRSPNGRPASSINSVKKDQ
ncbi:hypothetical protein GQX74_011258 [Glossina fuscipes]|nr:hypothetical protein GQX74_011258 [Glossina fuscipes]